MGRALNVIGTLPENAFAITPHDTTHLAASCAVYVGGDGDVTVYLVNGDGPITFSGMSAGDILPVKASRVMNTNTTATLLIGIY